MYKYEELPFKLVGCKRILVQVLFSFGCLQSIALAVTVQVGVSANVIQAVSITKNTDLSFGTFGPSSSSSGTIVVSPAGARSSTGGVGFVVTDPGNAATFSLSGNPGTAFAVSMPASVTINSGSNSMLVDNFTTKLSNSSLSAQAALLAVGATIHVQKNQALGKYTGNFAVTVDYQ